MLPSGTRRLFLLVSWSCHDGSAWWMRVGEVVKHRCMAASDKDPVPRNVDRGTVRR